MAGDFPTVKMWNDMAGGSTGSPERPRLDRAFKKYSNARNTKSRSGQPVTNEYDELQEDFKAYTTKKESAADSFKNTYLRDKKPTWKWHSDRIATFSEFELGQFERREGRHRDGQLYISMSASHEDLIGECANWT
jgi:hypothetical protein